MLHIRLSHSTISEGYPGNSLRGRELTYPPRDIIVLSHIKRYRVTLCQRASLDDEVGEK